MIWLHREDEDFRYSERELGSCGDCLEFVRWLCEQPLDNATFARGSDLGSLKPLNR